MWKLIKMKKNVLLHLINLVEELENVYVSKYIFKCRKFKSIWNLKVFRKFF